MAKGFDCAAPLNAATAKLFASQGFTFVGRYLAEAGSWKGLSPSEAQLIMEAGLYIVSFFERYANRVREGAAAGTADGRLALQYAREVGQPPGSAIYAAVDYDAPPSDFPAIAAYLEAFDAAIVGYELGVYGSYRVVKAMHERGLASKLMQTYAWSRGLKYDPISIYQYKNDVIVNGIGIDYNESNGDAGGWKKGMAILPKPVLDPGVAQTVINTWIKKSWAEAEAAKQGATADKILALTEQQKYYNQLANALRDASGLPRE
ncbi:glycoside hydrolase domain-containing protein [Paenibacillus puerhi]|uniref:glycoside hydrolase domain-containing protein n=1 Tax=Paenibacillus puerhi TaxID=2692622 RepID=UPI0013591D82|nr:glycoside hydrolase domain-containing protein [Paenibacillus puerhi]